MELKAHRAAWSGAHPENSLAALRECYREGVARAEIDFRLRDGDFIVAHDAPRRGAAVSSLREALAVVRAARSGPTLLMLDAKDDAPWSTETVEHLERLIEPVRDRVFVGSPADWNLRRLRAVDTAIALTFDPQYYLDWKPRPAELPGRRGAYGYHDAHPLGLRRTVPTAEYLRLRLEALLGQAPRIRELHVRAAFFERMLDDGLNVVALAHDAGVLVDVWTLNARTRGWRERLARAVEAGADIVTTDTPIWLAEAWQARGAAT